MAVTAMDTPADIDRRCSAIVFRGDAVLLVHRDGAGRRLPGRPGLLSDGV